MDKNKLFAKVEIDLKYWIKNLEISNFGKAKQILKKNICNVK